MTQLTIVLGGTRVNYNKDAIKVRREKKSKRARQMHAEFVFSSTQAMEKSKAGKLRIILIVTFSCKTYIS